MADGAPPFEIRPVEGKGMGIVATASIATGTVVLLEDPVLRVTREVSESFLDSVAPDIEWDSPEFDQEYLRFLQPLLQEQFVDLSGEVQASVMGLCDNYRSSGSTSLAGIFYTNSLPGGSLPSSSPRFRREDTVLCLTASRFNSNCRLNAAYHWCARTHCIKVQAVRQIQLGEEIQVYYGGDLLRPTEARQFTLSRWNFHCDCEACLDPKSDIRRGLIAQIDSDLSSYEFEDFAAAYNMAKQKIKLYEQEQVFWGGYMQAIHDCVLYAKLSRVPESELKDRAQVALDWVKLFFPDKQDLLDRYEAILRCSTDDVTSDEVSDPSSPDVAN
eukprot:CAMPEP_0180509782 /NCGR_PEP_ID=MMETSP1036_2-20121128/49913_1 /TAXON_ID=632150 /ORGANISM="Azadinium spinosum, Strain 3D9" /LENGTH=328 /DNA_ID=CAMNT_0022520227 /DNA_START=1 /DNA_END=987 /DNA_ORIENTATION=-